MRGETWRGEEGKKKKEDETEGGERSNPWNKNKYTLARCRPRNQWPIPLSVFSVPTSNNCVAKTNLPLFSFSLARSRGCWSKSATCLAWSFFEREKRFQRKWNLDEFSFIFPNVVSWNPRVESKNLRCDPSLSVEVRVGRISCVK